MAIFLHLVCGVNIGDNKLRCSFCNKWFSLRKSWFSFRSVSECPYCGADIGTKKLKEDEESEDNEDFEEDEDSEDNEDFKEDEDSESKIVSLLDSSFDTFMTTAYIKYMYLSGLLCILLATGAAMVMEISENGRFGWCIGYVLMFFASIFFWRLLCEAWIVIFRIAEAAISIEKQNSMSMQLKDWD